MDVVRGRLRRPPVVALSGVDLTVAQGELCGLAGPNGAGKSTLLRAIAGLLLPGEGEVRVCGKPPRQPAVAYAVSGDRSHFWRLSGRENLHFFASLHGMSGPARTDRVREVLAVVELGSAADRPVREYSTGMRQRLSLARGLLGRPQVLLLDEPTRGLDPRSTERIRTFVADELVGRQGVTVLLATHDASEMRELCPRVVLLAEGRVRADGPFEDVQPAFDEVFG